MSKNDEFVIRVPEMVTLNNRKYSVLKFNGTLNVDVVKWLPDSVSMQREDNEMIFTTAEKMPASGQGSEFGRQWREDARRKKMGYSSTRYSNDDQPWILTLDAASSNPKKYRGIKEGGFGQNADYWVFVKGGDGLFDAFPVDDCYNFMPVARYKTLNAEEAEEKFSQRNKILNQFALKIQQKLEKNDVEQSSGDEPKKQSAFNEDFTDKSKKKQLDEEDDVKPTCKVNLKEKKRQKRKIKRQKDADDEDTYAPAESDDGDDEGREVDYMSDSELSYSSVDEPEDAKVRKALVGVDEMNVDQKGDDFEFMDDDETNEDDQEEDENQRKFDLAAETVPTVGVGDEQESDSGSESDDPDADGRTPFFLQKFKPKSEQSLVDAGSLPSTSASSDDSSLKRKMDAQDASQPKRSKIEKSSEKDGGITLEEVRKYLQRKPQSSKDLVAKFKPKCHGMAKIEIVKSLAEILKQLAPQQIKRNDTIYFSLKK